jgi:lipoate-protein ligase A
MLRFIHHGRGDPAWNMAVDEALLRHCSAPVLRVYGWTVPAVSIGYFQSLAIAPPDRPFVRRLTGGGLVDHAHDVTYTVILPPHHPLVAAGTATSYRLLHEAIARALKSHGVACSLAADCSGGASAACFQKPVRFDVVAPDGHKLAGAAQRRSRHGVLHQGSILVPHLPARFADALLREVAGIFGQDAQPDDLSPDEHATATDLSINRYATDNWNRRR